jgi:hypothetical protein
MVDSNDAMQAERAAPEVSITEKMVWMLLTLLLWASRLTPHAAAGDSGLRALECPTKNKNTLKKHALLDVAGSWFDLLSIIDRHPNYIPVVLVVFIVC